MKPFSEANKLSSVILKCGTSGSAIIPQTSSPATAFAFVSINTSGLGNSCIQLNFTSNIIANDWLGGINFQLYKSCNGQIQSTPVGPQWTFFRSTGLNTINISTFAFSVCDCNICPSKECIYSVVAFPTAIIVGNAVIINGTLSALAVGNANENC